MKNFVEEISDEESPHILPKIKEPKKNQIDEKMFPEKKKTAALKDPNPYFPEAKTFDKPKIKDKKSNCNPFEKREKELYEEGMKTALNISRSDRDIFRPATKKLDIVTIDSSSQEYPTTPQTKTSRNQLKMTGKYKTKEKESRLSQRLDSDFNPGNSELINNPPKRSTSTRPISPPKYSQMPDKIDINLLLEEIIIDQKKYISKNFQFQPTKFQLYLKISEDWILVHMPYNQILEAMICEEEKTIYIQGTISPTLFDVSGSDRIFLKFQNDEAYFKQQMQILRNISSAFGDAKVISSDHLDKLHFRKLNEKKKDILKTTPNTKQKKTPKKRKRDENDDFDYTPSKAPVEPEIIDIEPEEINSDSETEEKESSTSTSLREARHSKRSSRLNNDPLPEIDDTKEILLYNNIQIIERDVKRLNDEEMLNDNIIDFYLSHIENILIEEPSRKHYKIFKTSFWPILKKDIDRAAERIPSKEEKIFEKKYVIIPINEHAHWTVLIVCHPGDEYDEITETGGFILFFDSLGNGSSGQKTKKIRDYLTTRYFVETGQKRTFTHKNLPARSPKLPIQPNGYDCGVYLLHYVQLFVEKENKDECKDKNSLKNWFDSQDILKKRSRILKLLEFYSKKDLTYLMKPTRKSRDNVEIYEPATPEKEKDTSKVDTQDLLEDSQKSSDKLKKKRKTIFGEEEEEEESEKNEEEKKKFNTIVLEKSQEDKSEETIYPTFEQINMKETNNSSEDILKRILNPDITEVEDEDLLSQEDDIFNNNINKYISDSFEA
eukprot:gene1001-9907_t